MNLPVNQNEMQSPMTEVEDRQLKPAHTSSPRTSETAESLSTSCNHRKESKTRKDKVFSAIKKILEEYFAPILSGAILYLVLWAFAAAKASSWQEHADEFFCHAAFGDAVPILIGLLFVGVSIVLSCHKWLVPIRTLFANPVLEFAHHAALLGAGALTIFNLRMGHFGHLGQDWNLTKYLLFVGGELQATKLTQKLLDRSRNAHPRSWRIFLATGISVILIGGWMLIENVKTVEQINACSVGEHAKP